MIRSASAQQWGKVTIEDDRTGIKRLGRWSAGPASESATTTID